MLDGPAMLCVLTPAAAGTLRIFNMHAQDVFRPYVEQQLGKGHRNYVVCENYLRNYLKAQTWDTRGK